MTTAQASGQPVHSIFHSPVNNLSTSCKHFHIPTFEQTIFRSYLGYTYEAASGFFLNYSEISIFREQKQQYLQPTSVIFFTLFWNIHLQGTEATKLKIYFTRNMGNNRLETTTKKKCWQRKGLNFNAKFLKSVNICTMFYKECKILWLHTVSLLYIGNR